MWCFLFFKHFNRCLLFFFSITRHVDIQRCFTHLIPVSYTTTVFLKFKSFFVVVDVRLSLIILLFYSSKSMTLFPYRLYFIVCLFFFSCGPNTLCRGLRFKGGAKLCIQKNPTKLLHSDQWGTWYLVRFSLH